MGFAVRIAAVVVVFVTTISVGVSSAGDADGGDLWDADCPNTTTTSHASTTSTTLDPRCVILGTGVTKKDVASADEVWFGDIHTDGHAGCLNTWDGNILVVVKNNRITKQSFGAVTTTGQESGGVSCYGSTPYRELFDVRGRASDDRVRLKFVNQTDECLALAAPDGSVRLACWGVPGGSIARKKSGASGTFTTDLGGNVFTTTVKLSDL